MTIAAVVDQLRQAKQHLSRARQLLVAALAEVRQAEALLRETLGPVRDRSVYEVPAKVTDQIRSATAGSDQAEANVDEWIARILGTPGPGGGPGK